jgi:hypothetical protein
MHASDHSRNPVRGNPGRYGSVTMTPTERRRSQSGTRLAMSPLRAVRPLPRGVLVLYVVLQNGIRRRPYAHHLALDHLNEACPGCAGEMFGPSTGAAEGSQRRLGVEVNRSSPAYNAHRLLSSVDHEQFVPGTIVENPRAQRQPPSPATPARLQAARSILFGMATSSWNGELPGQATDRVERRRLAEGIARKHEVDAGDVEHVLSNLTLPPLERLRRSMRRARLGRAAR